MDSEEKKTNLPGAPTGIAAARAAKAAAAAAAASRRAAGGAAFAAAAASRRAAERVGACGRPFDGCAASKAKREAAAQRTRADGASSLADGPYTSDGIVVSYSSGEESSDDEEMVLTARPIERIEVSPAPMMDDFLQPRCDLGTVGADACVFVCTCIKCFKSVDTRCELCSKDAYRKQVDVFCNACLRADASIGASLQSGRVERLLANFLRLCSKHMPT